MSTTSLQPDAGRELGREDAPGAELVDDVGHVDERVAAVEVGEQPLVLRLEAVVDLLGEAGPQLLDERPGLEAGEQHPHQADEEVAVVEVGLDRLVDARVLDLDGDGPSVVGHRPVDLADGRGGDRRRVPLGEDARRAPCRAPAR